MRRVREEKHVVSYGIVSIMDHHSFYQLVLPAICSFHLTQYLNVQHINHNVDKVMSDANYPPTSPLLKKKLTWIYDRHLDLFVVCYFKEMNAVP